MCRWDLRSIHDAIFAQTRSYVDKVGMDLRLNRLSLGAPSALHEESIP